MNNMKKLFFVLAPLMSLFICNASDVCRVSTSDSFKDKYQEDCVPLRGMEPLSCDEDSDSEDDEDTVGIVLDIALSNIELADNLESLCDAKEYIGDYESIFSRPEIDRLNLSLVDKAQELVQRESLSKLNTLNEVLKWNSSSKGYGTIKGALIAAYAEPDYITLDNVTILRGGVITEATHCLEGYCKQFTLDSDTVDAVQRQIDERKKEFDSYFEAIEAVQSKRCAIALEKCGIANADLDALRKKTRTVFTLVADCNKILEGTRYDFGLRKAVEGLAAATRRSIHKRVCILKRATEAVGL